jgi:hypothetical protein
MHVAFDAAPCDMLHVASNPDMAIEESVAKTTCIKPRLVVYRTFRLS